MASIQEKTKSKNKAIPKYLIRDEIDGKPYFYKGYKTVLNKGKKPEDIMGASGLQSLVIHVFLEFLYKNVGTQLYRFFTNEVGGHLENKNNLSFDIAIFDKKILTIDKINEHYVDVPPKVVIEIDVKIEAENETAIEYVTKKTDKILAFGTEKVIWVLTKSKKVMIATADEDWRTMNWNKDFELMDNHIINLQQLLKEEGLKFN